MKKEIILLYESESIVAIDDLLDWKSVRIYVPKQSNRFWIAKVTNYKTNKNYNREYLDCMMEDEDYLFNTSDLNVGDIITSRVLLRDSSTYAHEAKVHFRVESINDKGIHITLFDTLYKAIKDSYQKQKMDEKLTAANPPSELTLKK